MPRASYPLSSFKDNADQQPIAVSARVPASRADQAWRNIAVVPDFSLSFSEDNGQRGNAVVHAAR
jgi:hypothetical protein